jgi:dCTP deaminase
MPWSDRDFLDAVASGRFAAEPWLPDDLTPNGLDLRIGQVLVPLLAPEPVSEGKASVPPMTRFVVGTSTVLRMPDDAAGSLWLRSSFARRGVLASFGKVDAGFRGNLTIGAFNAAHEPLELAIGDRFCQIVLEPLERPAERGYAQRSGTYQDQRGITLATAASGDAAARTPARPGGGPAVPRAPARGP